MNRDSPDVCSELKASQNGNKLNSKIDWDALRRRSIHPGGFGADRRDIWPKLLNVKTPPPCHIAPTDDAETTHSRANDEDGQETRMATSRVNATNPNADHKDEYQIRLDTDRSFVLYPEESEPGINKDQLKADLNRLIVSVFRSRPKLNYFQGYHDIMTVIYLTLPQELQLACAEKLSLQRLRDSMLPSLEPVLGLLRVLKNLLRLADPEYAKLLGRDSPLPFYALSNLLTLFSHDMPTLPLIQHAFDYLLCRPPIAVVYLTAAVVLARKDYIQSLEGQLEPFMLHPILSTLPPLTEGFELTEEKPPDYQPEYILSSSSSNDIKKELGDEQSESVFAADVKRESSSIADKIGRLPTLVDNVKSESVAAVDIVKQELSESSCIVDGIGPSRPPTLVDNVKAESDVVKQELFEPSCIVDGIGSSRPPTPDPTRPVPPGYDSAPTNTTQTSAQPKIKSEPNTLSASLDTDLPLPTTPIPLPTILAHSDALLAQYPPSHPSLRLSSIMGPQSVVFTWSENLADLPSDATAEAMVSRPELVVYPVGPDEMEDDEEEGDGDDDSESDSDYDDKSRGKTPRKSIRRRKGGKEGDKGGGLRKRTRQKTIKKKVQKLLKMFGTTTGADQQLTHVDGRTMVAGAVLVLGVAIAIYGIQPQGGIAGLGIGDASGTRLGVSLNALIGNRHGHLHLHDELKKVANVLVGVGAKFLNLRDGATGGGN